MPEWITRELPPRFLAVAEAFAAQTPLSGACEETGRALARDGISLGEALDGLRATAHLITGEEPRFEDLRVLSEAWSEATLSYLSQLSCTDPLTGLSTLAHLRTAVADLYRSADANVENTQTLVVVEAPQLHGGDQTPIARAMVTMRLGESARTVFAQAHTIGALGARRVVVLAERDDRLARRVTLLRTMVAADRARVWIEGLPDTDFAATLLLDDLTRD
ncbi:hypothetical protein ACLM5J_16390 [Nocardioides sp. Bht2]|uniref:hypothetical protein n=1 Tax=Nocardioides sp. Bht2 TaxID=3392297 RepID=UPI0039B5044E